MSFASQAKPSRRASGAPSAGGAGPLRRLLLAGIRWGLPPAAPAAASIIRTTHLMAHEEPVL